MMDRGKWFLIYSVYEQGCSVLGPEIMLLTFEVMNYWSYIGLIQYIASLTTNINKEVTKNKDIKTHNLAAPAVLMKLFCVGCHF